MQRCRVQLSRASPHGGAESVVIRSLSHPDLKGLRGQCDYSSSPRTTRNPRCDHRHRTASCEPSRSIPIRPDEPQRGTPERPWVQGRRLPPLACGVPRRRPGRATSGRRPRPRPDMAASSLTDRMRDQAPLLLRCHRGRPGCSGQVSPSGWHGRPFERRDQSQYPALGASR